MPEEQFQRSSSILLAERIVDFHRQSQPIPDDLINLFLREVADFNGPFEPLFQILLSLGNPVPTCQPGKVGNSVSGPHQRKFPILGELVDLKGQDHAIYEGIGPIAIVVDAPDLGSLFEALEKPDIPDEQQLLGVVQRVFEMVLSKGMVPEWMQVEFQDDQLPPYPTGEDDGYSTLRWTYTLLLIYVFAHRNDLYAVTWLGEAAARLGRDRVAEKCARKLLRDFRSLAPLQLAQILHFFVDTLLEAECEWDDSDWANYTGLYPAPKLGSEKFALIRPMGHKDELNHLANWRITHRTGEPARKGLLKTIISQIISSGDYNSQIVAAVMHPIRMDLGYWNEERWDWALGVTGLSEVYQNLPTEWWFWVAYWDELSQDASSHYVWSLARRICKRRRQSQLVVMSALHEISWKLYSYLHGNKDTSELEELVNDCSRFGRASGMHRQVYDALQNLSSILKDNDIILDEETRLAVETEVSHLRSHLETLGSILPRQEYISKNPWPAKEHIDSAKSELANNLGTDTWVTLHNDTQNALADVLCSVRPQRLNSAEPDSSFSPVIRLVTSAIEREFYLKIGLKLYEKFGRKRIRNLFKDLNDRKQTRYSEICGFLMEMGRDSFGPKDIKSFILANFAGGRVLMDMGSHLDRWRELWGRSGHGGAFPPADVEDVRLFIKTFFDEGLLRRFFAAIQPARG